MSSRILGPITSDSRPLKPIAVWVLIALANQPCHAYSVCNVIRAKSGMTVMPNRSTVRSTVLELFEKGFLREAYAEAGKGSKYDRQLYEITESGWPMLKYER